jgi:hypothetical protein
MFFVEEMTRKIGIDRVNLETIRDEFQTVIIRLCH